MLEFIFVANVAMYFEYISEKGVEIPHVCAYNYHTMVSDLHTTKLMRIELSNREWSFLRLLSPPRIVTIIVIVPHPIFEIVDARCIDLEL